MHSLQGFATPPKWCNQDLTLYHGTIDKHVQSVLWKVDLTQGKPNADFGKGFYTTTVRRQAESWAWQLSLRTGSSPAVVSFCLKRGELAKFDSLWFVRGNFDAADFWSLVFHCRRGGDHNKQPGGWYDVVVGPVAAFWRQRLAIYDADQVSFHTSTAADLLNDRNKTTVRIIL